MTLTRAERAWMISQVFLTLTRKHGLFPRAVTTRRHERERHRRRKLVRMRKIWREQHLEELLDHEKA